MRQFEDEFARLARLDLTDLFAFPKPGGSDKQVIVEGAPVSTGREARVTGRRDAANPSRAW